MTTTMARRPLTGLDIRPCAIVATDPDGTEHVASDVPAEQAQFWTVYGYEIDPALPDHPALAMAAEDHPTLLAASGHALALAAEHGIPSHEITVTIEGARAATLHGVSLLAASRARTGADQ